jgi:Fe-S cluster biosynthesis and repair protein YggX
MNNMPTIYCLKLKRELPGLNNPPLPGDLGKKIAEHISQDAWQLWLNRQVMLINEYKLNLADPQARQFLMQQAEQFLFYEDDASSLPKGYVDPK